jgi:hypothetical protein
MRYVRPRRSITTVLREMNRCRHRSDKRSCSSIALFFTLSVCQPPPFFLQLQVRFQHAELVLKRNQLQEQQTTGPLGQQATTERQQLLDQLHHTIQGYRTKKGRSGSSTSTLTTKANLTSKKVLHSTALVELLQEKIPIGQTEVPNTVLRQWIRFFDQNTVQRQDQEVTLQTELKQMQQMYRDLLLQQQTNTPHYGTKSTSSSSSSSTPTTEDGRHADVTGTAEVEMQRDDEKVVNDDDDESEISNHEGSNSTDMSSAAAMEM